MPTKLFIFDIGVHRGEDTYYYLACGPKVVAFETAPVLFREGVLLFIIAISNGQLQLLHAAIIGLKKT